MRQGAENVGGGRAPFLHPCWFELYCCQNIRVERVEMHRNKHISCISRVTLLTGVRGHCRGLRKQAGAGHPFSTHIALNRNFGTRSGWKLSKCIEIGIYQASPGSLSR